MIQTVTKEEYEIADIFLAYRKDPVGFAINVLGLREEYIWPKMVELLEAVRDHQKVAVRAGHYVSKTYSLGRIVVPWFKTCFVPSTVITTAPSDLQVRGQLWREVHAAVVSARVELGGKLTSLQWDLKPPDSTLETLSSDERAQWEKNFAIGFSTSPDSTAEHATRMQGWHNEWVMVIIDEACGMAPQIWRTAVEGLINDDQCKMVAIGNPTDPECEFAKACYSSIPGANDSDEAYTSDKGWYVVTIDARTTPNYQQRRRVIPGLASYEWVQGIFKAYGEDGDGARYRVKGLFPTHKEGSYYGDKLAEARRDGRIGEFPHDKTYPVYTFSDYGDMYTGSIFVQFIKGRIRIIDDYYDYEGGGAPKWCLDCDGKGYQYMDHIAGPDLSPDGGSNKKSFATGELIVKTLSDLGYDVHACEPHDFESRIRVGREIWDMVEVNEPKCSTFIEAASGYTRTKNLRLSSEGRPAYHDHPSKTWHPHIMDAFGHMAISYRSEQYMGNTIEGLEVVHIGEDSHSCWNDNLFKRGKR